MATSVTLPALGESVTEGTVTRWLKQPGEEVQADEPLLEISTDKVDTEIPSPVSGVLLEIKVQEDETVEVGAELALIGDAAETGGEAAAPAGQSEQEQPQAQPAEQDEPLLGEPQQQEAQPEAEQPQAEQPQAEQPRAEPAGEGTPVTLPALGESVTEGTVTRWLKQVGDSVEVDEPLLEISTDKVDTEIPSPVAGTVMDIKVAEDETVEVGAELAIIGTAGAAAAPTQPSQPEAEPEPAQAETPLEEEVQERAAAEAQSLEMAEAKAERQPAPAQPAPAPQPARPQQQAPAPAAAPSGDGAPYVTPLVRKLAAEHNVDLPTITGTGVGGRIRKQDVLAAAEAAKQAASAAPAPASVEPAAATPAVEPSPLRGKTEKLSRIRKVIAQRVHESLQNTAQLTTVVEVDVTAIAKLREQTKRSFEQREGVKLSFLPFFAKAAIEALKAHPKLNATIDIEAGEVTYHDTENLALAVDTDRGLMVPVIHNAGDLNISGLAKRIADLARRTRDNKLKPDDVAGGTFTLTNTGSRGALFDTPIFFEPQVAILGTGTVVKRPVVVHTDLGETIAIRHMMYLALSYDHRLIDGADAARFLTTIKQRLEAGQFEGDLGG
ncbi:MAG TPA: 2-oxoglutarate dehydrogenase, E2 component, dihydrolipoamide succinyltransferase [Jiangellaceae bacterium]|nr:2-oxoglutarate dehydrogenase, E2 component, dihydrolipoamide succinyltransferase [Jiangellaceae bacterium]